MKKKILFFITLLALSFSLSFYLKSSYASNLINEATSVKDYLGKWQCVAFDNGEGDLTFYGRNTDYAYYLEFLKNNILKNITTKCGEIDDKYEIIDGENVSLKVGDFEYTISDTMLIESVKGPDFSYKSYYFKLGSQVSNMEKMLKQNGIPSTDLPSGETGSNPNHTSLNLSFTDVDENSWYAMYVSEVFHDGIMLGKSDKIFAPNDFVTLQEVAAISAKMHGILGAVGPDFTPKNGEKWYMPYVRYCYENNIYNNENVKKGKISLENSQKWNKPATRAEVASFLGNVDIRYAKNFINPDVPLTDIPDVNNNTPFAQDILTLYRMGVAVGDENMAFKPNEFVKRAEIAAMATRIMHDDFKIELPRG